VVQINKTSNSQLCHSTTNDEIKEGSKSSKHEDPEGVLASQSKSQMCGEDWGSDDDDSHFLEIESPGNLQTDECFPRLKSHDSAHVLAVENYNDDRNDQPNNRLDTSGSSIKENTEEIQVRKFPGPAGFLLPFCNQTNSSKSRGQQVHKRKRNPEDDVDGLYDWDEALKLLDITQAWNRKKINIQWIKRKFASGAVYLISPILIVGIKSIEYTQGDAICVLQDPTGETAGTIHQLVFEEEYGKFLKMGSILLLRRPAILTSAPVHSMVTITKTCLFGIYSTQETSQNKMIQCHKYDDKDLQAWFMENVVSGDPLNKETDSALISGPAQTLFSGGANKTPNRSSFSTPKPKSTINHINKPPFKSHVLPTNPSSFQCKFPSASLSPSMSVSTVAAVKSPADSGAEDQFLSQLLDGVDTDSLFDDF